MAMANGTVYEAAHPGGAAAIVDEFATEMSVDYDAADGVPNLDSSRCFQLKKTDELKLLVPAYCVASVDQYVFEASGSQFKDIQQRIAAQYAMLTAN